MTTCQINLLGSPELGHIFVVGFRTIKNSGKVQINFENIDELKPLTPLALTIDFKNKQIVMNSSSLKTWNDADVKEAESLEDGIIKVYIFTTDDRFHIAINETMKFQYKFRSQLEHVKTIKVSGDIEKVFQMDHRRAYPNAWPPIQFDIPNIAFSGDVPHHFQPGSLIVIKAKIFGSKDGSFFIRFNDRATPKQLLHFNPRFSERVIVVNSMNDSLEWLHDEQRFSDFPFSIDKEFQLVIAMQPSAFKVAVNGEHLLTSSFRMTKSNSLPKSFDGVHEIYEKLTGFKIVTLNGLKMRVNLVDHLALDDPECSFYEIFSNSNFRV